MNKFSVASSGYGTWQVKGVVPGEIGGETRMMTQRIWETGNRQKALAVAEFLNSESGKELYTKASFEANQIA